MKAGRKLGESEARKVFGQLLSALAYLHENRIAHSDIKLDNILYDEALGKVKLVDFGSSSLDPAGNPPSLLCGTFAYMSPELVSQSPAVDHYKADVWALGVALYVSTTGLFPFKAKTEQELRKKITRRELAYPSTLTLSSELKKLICSMLSPQELRPGAKELRLEPWLSEASYN